MDLELPLDEMSTQEKLLLMETIWDNLSQEDEELQSPDWHKEKLNQREKSISEGNSEFLDWDEAKENIKNSIE